MKVKRFKNLWAMGLIIFGAILIALYLLKFICPEFVIGVAEIPAIVKFGEWVDSNLITYYIYTFLSSFAIGYVYCCACCRKRFLGLRDVCILIVEILFLLVMYKLFPTYSITFDMLAMLIMPLIMCAFDKKNDVKYTYSTITCLSIHYLSQIFSLIIRDICVKISYPNSATFTILLIDNFIWLVMLYCFFNYKNKKGEQDNGKT